jgi:hypothetical protein
MEGDRQPGGSGVVAFSFGGSAVPAASSVKAMTLGAQSLPPNLTAVLVSIRNEAGEAVADKRRLALTAFGAGYVSESVALSPGTYAVTEFIIVDETNAARYATPIEGSEKADLVEDPLPVSFTVAAADTETVALEVNFDMLGKNARNELYVSGTAPFPYLKPILVKVAATAPVSLKFGHDTDADGKENNWSDQSDHYAFGEKGVPWVYFGVEDHP